MFFDKSMLMRDAVIERKLEMKVIVIINENN